MSAPSAGELFVGGLRQEAGKQKEEEGADDEKQKEGEKEKGAGGEGDGKDVAFVVSIEACDEDDDGEEDD